MHHQAVRTPGEDIVVSATAPDGTIEAIESRNGQIVAVQWHPEGLIHSAPEMNRLFADLVETAEKKLNDKQKAEFLPDSVQNHERKLPAAAGRGNMVY